MKVLILSYYWPPSSGSGVQRWLKFAKYLPDNGWEPVIITPRNGTAAVYDEGLLKDVRPGTEVIYTRTLEPFVLYNLLQGKRKEALIPIGVASLKEKKGLFHKLANSIRGNLFVPDARKGWVPYAYKAAKHRIEKGDIDLVVTTGPPHSAHLTGLKLKRKLGVKWVADMRDPWSNIYYNSDMNRLPFIQAWDKAMESQVLQEADAVTVVSTGMQEEFAERAKAVKVIYNGYDEADFGKVEYERSNTFRITYTGTLLSNMDSPALWRAIKRLMDKCPSGSIQLQLAGNVDATVLDSLKNHGLMASVLLRGHVAHGEAVKMMIQSELLLFIIANTPGNQSIVGGKLFEYLASGTEILALGPEVSAAGQILKEQNRPPMSQYHDEEALFQKLDNAFTNWSLGPGAHRYSGAMAKAYSRAGLTKLMAQLFNELIQR